MKPLSLQELGAAHGTDKGDANHAFLGRSYLDVYDQYFGPLRNDALTLLEIGVWRGASLRMWADYFPSSRIAGLDIDPLWHGDKRAEVFTGSQTDPDCLDGVLKQTGRPNIIIDDGSHITEHVAESFRLLWPVLAPGGWYVVEDTAMSYDGSSLAGCPGMEHNGKFQNNRGTLDEMLLPLIRRMDHLGGDVRTIHFHPMQVFIQKT